MPKVILAIVGLCAAIEAALTLLGGPLTGLTGLRNTALVYGAFWPGLFAGWDPIWSGQPMAMFVTHAFLHGGLLHLVMNMLILVHLGRETVARVGGWGFALIYLLCAAGGGVGFLLLSASPGPMVGASGAIFGLFGVTQFWDWQRRRATGAPLGPVWRTAAGLVVMNLVLWVMTGGYLAWEAHLGGYVTGVVLARVVTPSLRHRLRPF